MAVSQTGAIYKAFSFDNVSSRTYGVYITGEAVYNAPERDVEMISIPGRNGAFALDRGRFENIEVRYPGGIFADNETDFAQAVSDLRNYLCSKKGYFRLTDEYNPNEYRMAVYKSGLEVSPVQAKAGEFEIIFDCKPQRYLTSGETPITAQNGSTITNPTRFDASPMLEADGYGTIGINGKTIEIRNEPLGETQLSGFAYTAEVSLDVSNLNTGDLIYKNNTNYPRVDVGMKTVGGEAISIQITSVTNGTAFASSGGSKATLSITPTFPSIVNGTSKTQTTAVSLTIDIGGTTYTGTYSVSIAYTKNSNSIELHGSRSNLPSTSVVKYNLSYYHPPYLGDSTKLVYPSPMYIDLEIGEAYGEVNGEILSLNNIVSMPADLPMLKAGSNAVTFDNTITDLKIVPRWWIV